MEQKQQRHRATAHPLFADVDSEGVQAATRRLFDASILLEDSEFRDFVSALCKLSSEMVSMQSGVGVGASVGTGEGVLDAEEDYISRASMSATNFVASHTEQFSRGGLVRISDDGTGIWHRHSRPDTSSTTC